MPPSKSEKAWAVVRIVLGTLQVFAATLTLIFALQLGNHPVTFAPAVAAGALTATGMFLFRDDKTNRREEL